MPHQAGDLVIHRVTIRRHRASLVVALTSAAILLAGCQGGDGVPRVGIGGEASTTPSARVVTVQISPADGATGVLPSALVKVTPSRGAITSAKAVDDRGHALKLADDGSGAWTSSHNLRPDARYTVTVHAPGRGGTDTVTTSTFRTLKPQVTATYGVVYDGQTVGVGMPVSIQFDSAVTTPEFRVEVEKQVKVSSSPVQEGAWGWLDDRQLMWRPKTYWKPGTKVTVDAALTGVQTGDGKWVGTDAHGGFTVGAAMISSVNIKSHTMTVTRNGTVIRTIPVSTGKPGPKTETRSGTKVIISKEGKVTMDSATVGIPKGDPNYYHVETNSNLRLTWTGEYIHSAPWSVSAQGSQNVSHGCTNMSPANAKWMFDHSRVGDVVRFTGSSRVFQPDEGIGVWQYSWSAWQRQGALL
jgi:lipoprotein-anchoring transpeptidase ErfK/SrfK